MNWKLSQETKDVFDTTRFIASLVGLVAIVCGVLYPDNIPSRDNFGWLEWTGFGVLVLIILSPFIALVGRHIHLRNILRKGHLSEHIIERQETTIDILDDTHAQLLKKIYFKKIEKNSKQEYANRINVSGGILPETVRTSNCSYTLDCEEREIKIFYKDGSKSLNTVPNVYKKLDEYLLFSFMMKDSFKDKVEYWGVQVQNLTQEYCIEIKLPPHKRAKYAKFFRFDDPEKKGVSIQPLLLRDNNRDKIVLQVMNFDKNEKYRIEWEYFD